MKINRVLFSALLGVGLMAVPGFTHAQSAPGPASRADARPAGIELGAGSSLGRAVFERYCATVKQAETDRAAWTVSGREAGWLVAVERPNRWIMSLDGRGQSHRFSILAPAAAPLGQIDPRSSGL